MKVRLVIDTTNIFYRALFTAAGFDKSTPMFTYETQYECDRLMQKLCIDISYILGDTGADQVHFCYDDSSWRKKKFAEYKSSREQDERLNWKNIFTILHDFKQIAKQNHFGELNIKNAEADDQIALMCEKHLSSPDNGLMIIVSADEDVRQLINSNGDSHVIAYNPIRYGKDPKKIYVSKDFNDWYHSVKVFSGIFNPNVGLMSSGDDQGKILFGSILTKTNAMIVVTDGPEIAFRKVFCGDSGDDVPSFMTWVKKEGAKPINITEKRYLNKIRENLNIKYVDDLNNTETVDKLVGMLKDFKGSDIDFDINERITRQKEMVELKRENFPAKIVETFDEIYPDIIADGYVLVKDLTMPMMLQGTKYITEDTTGFTAPPKMGYKPRSSYFSDFDK